MTWTLQAFRTAVRDELGPEIALLVGDGEIDRWVNQGKDLLGVSAPLETTLTWAVGDESVDLPAGFRRKAGFLGSVALPPHRVWGSALVFTDSEGASYAGTGRLLYHGYYPAITGAAPSQLPDVGNYACVSYCLYRFFKRLASSRSDYRKYATLTGSNGVDLDELDGLSERHFADFEAVKDELEVAEPAFFHGG